MDDKLVPSLLLLVVPILYVGWRLGLLDHRVGRWALGGVAALALALVAPWGGAGPRYQSRLGLLILIAVAMALAARRWRAGWTLEPGRLRLALGGLAVLSVLVWVDFFGFHGAGTYLHHHDLAHYYLGSKYFDELGYTGLYEGLLRAESELAGGSVGAARARDLETYETVPVGVLLARSDAVRSAFTPRRWADFRRDVDLFRGAMGPYYDGLVMDHGFNATPTWALLGGGLGNLVPAGSARGVLLLALLDPLLLVFAFAAVAATFGSRALGLSVVYFCLLFGASFLWTGGSFLRHLWFSALVIGLCMLQRKRHAVAGACFGLAGALQIFPFLFVLPLAFKAVSAGLRRRRSGRRCLVFLGALAATAAVLVGLTGLLPRGFRHWQEFSANSSRHLEVVSPNVVSLTQILAHPPRQERVSWEEFRRLKARRAGIYRAQLVLAFVPVLLLVARLSRWQTDLGAVALALPLLFVGLNLSAYYYVFLVVLPLVLRNRPGKLSLIFAAEAAVYALTLFVEREASLYVYRGIALALLFAALFLGPLRREMRWARRVGRPATRPTGPDGC